MRLISHLHCLSAHTRFLKRERAKYPPFPASHYGRSVLPLSSRTSFGLEGPAGLTSEFFVHFFNCSWLSEAVQKALVGALPNGPHKGADM